MMYQFNSIEKKWQRFWESINIFQTDENSNKPRTYILEMLPYPSGSLHMGHVRNYTIGDVIARFKKLNGFNVLHPMGWDAFGLPAENAAVENEVHPKLWINSNINHMKNQIQSLGLGYDWSREINTSSPNYYGIEQKFFLEFYKNGLIYQKKSWVNWDPIEKTVLANEQVINGRGWRSGTLVEKKELTQWFFKITKYSEELLNDLNDLNDWPKKVIHMQKKWIGKNYGANIKLYFYNKRNKFKFIEVFSTRPETIFGMSFCAVSIDHNLAKFYSNKDPNLKNFIDKYRKLPVSESFLSTIDKDGYHTGEYLMHPFIADKKIPLYVVNFVSNEYATGAIFGCPAHDKRDFEFAKMYNLPIIQVFSSEGIRDDTKKDDILEDIDLKDMDYQEISDKSNGFEDCIENVSINNDLKKKIILKNSYFLNGLSILEAREKIYKTLEEYGIGEKTVNFRLKDWCISRQRYWGCPIPIIHCKSCGPTPISEEELPIILPERVNFRVSGNPLNYIKDWKDVNCPKCNIKAERETDTLDTFFESSWYFFSYCFSNNGSYDIKNNKELVKKWMPISVYIGGIEHAVLHLLYARFFTKILRDLNYIDNSIKEPFKKLITQGMICHPTYKTINGEWLYPNQVTYDENYHKFFSLNKEEVIVGRSEKMSKSKKNLIDPMEIVKNYGADTVRLFILSDTPINKDLDWSDNGIDGCWRYINKLWNLSENIFNYYQTIINKTSTLKLLKEINKLIAKSKKYYENQYFNKIIAICREFTYLIEDVLKNKDVERSTLIEEVFKKFLIILYPIVPHITSEMWDKIHSNKLIKEQQNLCEIDWPSIDEILINEDEINLVIQINGKTRSFIKVKINASYEDIKEKALEVIKIKRNINQNKIKKVIFVPKRIINFLIEDD